MGGVTADGWMSLIGGFGGAAFAFIAAVCFEALLRHRKERATIRHLKTILKKLMAEFEEMPPSHPLEPFMEVMGGDKAARMISLLRDLRSTLDWVIDRAPIEDFDFWIMARNLQQQLGSASNSVHAKAIMDDPMESINVHEPAYSRAIAGIKGRIETDIPTLVILG